MKKAGVLKQALAAVVGLMLLPLPLQAETPFEIDVLLPLTGSATFIGQDANQGVMAAQSVINASGGIHGRPVNIVVQDDQSNPQVAVQIVNGLIAQHKSVIIAAELAAECNALAPLLKDGPVLYCLTPSVHPTPGSFVFSIDPATADQLPVAIRYLRERGLTRFSVITSTDASGQDAEHSIDGALATAENKAVSIVDREHFNTTDISVAAQMTRIKASNAQAIIAFTSGTPFGTVLRGAYEAGIDLPMLTSNANLNYAQMTQYAKMLPTNLYFPAYACVDASQVSDKRVKRAIADFNRALTKQGVKMEELQASVYDPALLIVEALRKLGTNASAEVLRAYIADTRDFPGVTGVYDFEAFPQRGLGQGAVLVVRWDTKKKAWVAVSKLGGALI